MKYNLEHERAVLAAIKLDNRMYDQVRLKPSDFYDKKNSELFGMISQIIESGRIADDLSIADIIQKNGSKLSVAYVASLEAVTTANISFYSESIKNLSKTRQIDSLLLTIRDGLETKNPQEVIDDIERKITDISENDVSNIKSLHDILLPAISEMEKCSKAGRYTGVQSGFYQLDELTMGFQAGDLIIIGARPSIGKTALALSMAVNMSVKYGVCVGFFSCEMCSEQLAGRIIAGESKINLGLIKSGKVNFSEILKTCEKLHKVPFFLDDTANISYVDLRSKVRQMKRLGCRIIFIDYLTLIRHGDPRMPRHERVGEIAKGLKALARELNIPIIALSQVGREAEGRMPTLANLRQSGEIEEDADVIMFLHRNRSESETKVSVAKNRNGATDEIRLVFYMQYVKFDES